MTLGAFVVTRDGATRIPVVVACLRSFADRVLVYVDDRSADDSLAVAVAAGAETMTGTPEDGMPEGAANECVKALDTDWVLRLDDDELIGPRLAQRIPRLLATGTGWRFPRYHVWPDAGRYITSDPYWPDWQLRLVRRDMWLERGGWPVRAHASPGWPCEFATAGMFHYKFLLFTKEQREARMRQWRENWPGAASDHYDAFSVVEGRNVQIAAIPEALPAQHFEAPSDGAVPA